MRAAPLARTALRIASAYAAAVFVSWAVARLGLPAEAVLAPGSAALIAAVLFTVRPAEGLGVFLTFSLLANTWQYLFTTDLRYFDELGLILFVLVGVTRHRVLNRQLRLGVAEVALLVVVVAGIVSSLINGVPTWIWVLGLVELFKGVAFFYLVLGLPLHRADVARVGAVIVGLALALLLLGLVEFLDPVAFQRALGLPTYQTTRAGLTVIKSLFLHPAVFGWLMVFASLLLFARFVVTRTWWTLPLALAFDVGAFLSGRRTPILGLALSLLVGLIWYWSRGRPWRSFIHSWAPVAASVVLLLVVFLPAVAGFYSDSIGEYGGSPDAIAEILTDRPDARQIEQVQPRTALYVASVAIARDDFPFGAGLGRFGSYVSRLEYSPVYARYGLDRVPGLSPQNRTAIDDTFWPSVLGEAGVIALLAFAVFIGMLFVRLWASALHDGFERQGIAFAGLLVFTQAFVASLTAGTYVAPPIAYFAFGSVAAILSTSASDRLRRADT